MSGFECVCCKGKFEWDDLTSSYYNLGSSFFCKECYLNKYLPFEIKRKWNMNCKVVDAADLARLNEIDRLCYKTYITIVTLNLNKITLVICTIAFIPLLCHR